MTLFYLKRRREHTIIHFGYKNTLITRLKLARWAITVEPTYQQFGSQKESASVAGTATVHYKSIELPVGVRHYFFFSDYSKLFLNVFYVADLSFDSYFRFKNDPYLKEIKPGGNFAFGAGYDCKKFGIEARYNMRRSVTETYLLWFSEYNKLSLIFAYRIF